ncbi:MAG TPA: GNAT family N-acyltransferase [Terriglobales bacterium]|nr:GNAT family N-acyltransferase [Terriglobales bacterium]
MFGSESLYRMQLQDVLPGAGTVPSAEVLAQAGNYRVRLAITQDDLRCLFRLRFLVFNIEMKEGLDTAYAQGEDRDQFDDVCHHLLVEETELGRIVGTYRVQTGAMAAAGHGYYSAQEFDFAPYERLRRNVVELGRACIHKDFRSFEVLNLLWRGIIQYAQARGGRYLIGCSSVTTQDTELGSAMYYRLEEHLVEPELRTKPTPAFAFPLSGAPAEKPQPPKLLRAYLGVGARIGGEPALDREFKTIDFLTLLDLEKMAPSARARYVR